MGCYPPLGKFVSKALGKCNGRERWRQERLDYALAYPPGFPTETHYMRPAARTVTFASTNSVYVIPPSPPPQQPQQQPKQAEQESPPEPQQPQAPPQHEPPEHHDAPPQPQPQPQAQSEQPAEANAEPPAQTQDGPPAEPKPPKAPKRGKKKQSGRVRFGPEQPPPQEQEQEQPPQEHEPQGPAGDGGGSAPAGPHQHGAAPAQQGLPPGFLLRYTPSPLPRWEATPRRHEYFSGEYRSYYPTPVREGIYRIATDANRLTTIFSEENPNACAIV